MREGSRGAGASEPEAVAAEHADAAVASSRDQDRSGCDVFAIDLTPAVAPTRIDGVVVGRWVGSNAAGEPLVDFAENPTSAPLPARAATRLEPDQVGEEVALLFERADPRRPLVIGVMYRPPQPIATAEPAPAELAPAEPMVAIADGKKTVVTAEDELVLRCGRASITLTRAGKILIRGAYVSTRSAGVNRIQGGSVQIN